MEKSGGAGSRFGALGRPLSEAVLAFGLGIGGLFAMGGISYLYMAPDEHGISTRVPWVRRTAAAAVLACAVPSLLRQLPGSIFCKPAVPPLCHSVRIGNLAAQIPRESSMPANDAAKGKGEPFVYKFAAAAGGDDAEDDDDDDE